MALPVSTEPFSNLPEETTTALSDVLNKWNDPNYSEDITVSYDWKSKALAALREGDVRKMRQSALPSLQFKIIQLAHEAKAETTQLEAARTVLAQEGQGPVQRIEGGINVRQMPEDQLKSFIISKLSRLQHLAGMDINQMLEQIKKQNEVIPIEAEIIEPEQE